MPPGTGNMKIAIGEVEPENNLENRPGKFFIFAPDGTDRGIVRPFFPIAPRQAGGRFPCRWAGETNEIYTVSRNRGYDENRQL